MIRLDKFVANTTKLGRKEVKQAIRRGRVRVGDCFVKDESKKIDESEKVYLDDKLVQYEQYSYWMLNKPSGVLSATTDASEQTVIDLLKRNHEEFDFGDVFPVGRLDKDTEGLLILTNNGELAHKLLSPKYHVDKKYYVVYDGILDENAAQVFETGIDIGEKRLTQPAALEVISDTECYVTIHEGKFHQVKKMISKVGAKVQYLKRVSFGDIVLDETLEKGKSRRLTEEEVEALNG